jgi:hypothetical protein
MSTGFGRLTGLALSLLAFFSGVPASAHLTPNSEVTLSIGDGAVAADIIVPLGEYAFASGNPAIRSPNALALARSYLLEKIMVRGADGRRWAVLVDRVEFVRSIGPPDLRASARFVPPSGASGAFSIDWRVVVDQVPSHFALFLKSRADGEREILGAVRRGNTRLIVDRLQDSALANFTAAVWLGIHHILEGYDHLAFLLALLLPAPLIAVGSRWASTRPLRSTVSRLAWIVTAFTVGHSVTLVGSIASNLTLPVAPVEIAIAVSVLIAALHAIRPLFAGREPLVAAGFGLVHGMAFATLVRTAGAGTMTSAISLLGFNLGIELVQLAIVAVTAPLLIVLSRSLAYRTLRIGVAGVFAGAAVWWMVSRVSGALALAG